MPIVGGVIQAPTSWLVKPEHPITHFASRIHGITMQDVADEPAFEAIADEVRQALDAPALVAHKAHVDTGVLKRQLPVWEVPEVFDTLKLDEGLPNELTPHRATYDALVTARLFVRLVTMSENWPLTLEELRGDSPNRNGCEASSLF